MSLFSPLHHFAKKTIPSMSDTEQDVIQTGEVWFDKELFSGNPNFSILESLPINPLTDAEQDFLNGPVEELCNTVDEWEITVGTKDMPQSVWNFLKENKFFGILIAKEHGGLGFSHNAFSSIIKKLISRVPTVASTVLIPNSLGPAGLLTSYGTSEQRDYYLPRLATGDEIPCFAMTSPFAGCDLANIPDIGHVEYGEFKGKKILGIRVTWEKRYITLAPVATVLGLAFRTFKDGEEIGMTCALIPTNHPGVVIGRRHWPARQNFMNGPTSGTDIFIPMSMVIGGEEMVGKGWKMFVQQLYTGRALSIPSLATGAVQYVARNVGAYAKLREQFKHPIGNFEGVQMKLASIAAEAHILECARRTTMAVMDAGPVPAVISALMKYQTTERARQVVNDGMDILGGRGVFEGPRNILFPIYQMIPIIITVEGANILTRCFITFGHGLMRCHKFLLSEYESIRTGEFKKFDRVVLLHIIHVLVSGFRSCAQSFFPQKIKSPAYKKIIALMSARYAWLVEMALISYGGTLKKRERLSGNFADVLSEMFFMSVVLRFYDDTKEDNVILTQWIFKRSTYRIEQYMDDIIHHLGNPFLKWISRAVVFPRGKRYKLPSIDDDKRVSKLLMSTNITRDMLTNGIYINRDSNDKTGCLESGLEIVTRGEQIELKHLRKILDVDDFDATLFESL
ncbi:MAG: acyl-CoA dehydrogenase [Patescibacteria group bacterium]